MTTFFKRIHPKNLDETAGESICLIGKLDETGKTLETTAGLVAVQGYQDIGDFENPTARYIEIRGKSLGNNVIEFKEGNSIPGEEIDLASYYEAVTLYNQVF